MDGRLPGGSLRCGSGGRRLQRDKARFLHTLALSRALPRTKMKIWGPESRGDPSQEEGKLETFGIQGLESGRADVKILVLCVGPSSKPESWGCASVLSFPVSFSRALYHSEQRNKESAPGPRKGGIAPRPPEGRGCLRSSP